MNTSSYIQSKNQTILWETINQTPNIQFISKNSKIQWFKNIIQYFHSTHSPPKTKLELMEMNKQTIQYMVNDLKTYKPTNANNDTTPANNDPTTIILNENNTHHTLINELKKETITTDLFNKKQKEFDDFFKNQNPQEIDFRIKEKDEPIQDITKLVEKHLKDREDELVKYAILDETIQQHTSIANKNNEPNISPKPIKKVTWENNENEVYLNNDGVIKHENTLKKETEDEWKKNIQLKIKNIEHKLDLLIEKTDKLTALFIEKNTITI
jgi:hypothetical protein